MAVIETTEPPAGSKPAAWPRVGLSDRTGLALAVLVPLMAYALVFNGYWVPAGDSEVFLVVARHLLRGEGFVFNGERVAFIPPGWPMVLAGLMAISPVYWLLKLSLVVFMTGAGALTYLTLRHFVTPTIACLAVICGALLSPAWPLTYWLHSDALFCLLAAGAGLAAVRLGEAPTRRGRMGWVLAVVSLCAMGVFVRWAGVLQWLLIVSLALSRGRRLRGPNVTQANLTGAFASTAATFGTFILLTLLLRTWANPSDAGGLPVAVASPTSLAMAVAEEAQPPDLFNLPQDETRGLIGGMFDRVLALPQWYSWTLWQPVRVGGTVGLAGWLVDWGLGVIVLALLLWATWVQGRRGQWPWLGVVLYATAIGMNWPHVNNRYMVPVGPWVIAGVLVGLSTLPWRRLAAFLSRWFVVSILIVNGALLAVDAWVFRSGSNFYHRYEAGLHEPLVRTGVYLANQPFKDNELGVSTRYENLNERWYSKLSTRAMVLLTERQVVEAPRPLLRSGIKTVQQWSRDNGIVYYVHQYPLWPGRFWHFRISREFHEQVTGYAPPDEQPPFVLFRMQPFEVEGYPEARWLVVDPAPASVSDESMERFTRRVPGL